MDDRELANAAAVFFGGRRRATGRLLGRRGPITDRDLAAASTRFFGSRRAACHVLTCDECDLDILGGLRRCRWHPDRVGEDAALTFLLGRPLRRSEP